jgi:hypothetical protein
VQIVDGATTLHVMTADGPQSFALKAGMVAIVPQGAWHRFDARALLIPRGSRDPRAGPIATQAAFVKIL